MTAASPLSYDRGHAVRTTGSGFHGHRWGDFGGSDLPLDRRARVLLVDDDADFVATWSGLLGNLFTIETLPDVESARRAVWRSPPDLILLDIEFEDGDGGFELLHWLQALAEAPPVIMLTNTTDAAVVVRAVQEGAFHYVCKPPDPNELVNLMRRALESGEYHRLVREHRERRERPGGGGGPPGRDAGRPYMPERSAVSRRLRQEIERIAPTDASVLITGEMGTGKGVVARVIHERSRAAAGPFVEVPLVALSQDLIDSELFGHVEGSFTNATRLRRGKLDSARGGTLFLDEIAEIPLGIQAKLLQTLQERRFHRIGLDDEMIPFEARVIAASNRDLAGEAARGRFRADLLSRLEVIHLHIPPLRERREDVLPLAHHFLADASGRLGKKARDFSPTAQRILLEHPWPGNVRQLSHAVEKAVIYCDGPLIGAGHLSEAPRPFPDRPPPYHEAWEARQTQFLREYYIPVLAVAEGNVSRVAELVGLPRQTVYRHLRRTGLDSEEFRTGGESAAGARE